MLQALRKLLGCRCDAECRRHGAELSAGALEQEHFISSIDRVTERMRAERQEQEKKLELLLGGAEQLEKADPVIAAVARRFAVSGEHLVLSERFSSVSSLGVRSNYSRIVFTGSGIAVAWVYDDPPSPHQLEPLTGADMREADINLAQIVEKIHAHARKLEREPLPPVEPDKALSPYLYAQRPKTD